MSRKYTKIEQYKNQILSMKKEGKTQREIAEKFGLEKEHHGDHRCGRRFLLRFGLCVRGAFLPGAENKSAAPKNRHPLSLYKTFKQNSPFWFSCTK